MKTEAVAVHNVRVPAGPLLTDIAGRGSELAAYGAHAAFLFDNTGRIDRVIAGVASTEARIQDRLMSLVAYSWIDGANGIPPSLASALWWVRVAANAELLQGRLQQLGVGRATHGEEVNLKANFFTTLRVVACQGNEMHEAGVNAANELARRTNQPPTLRPRNGNGVRAVLNNQQKFMEAMGIAPDYSLLHNGPTEFNSNLMAVLAKYGEAIDPAADKAIREEYARRTAKVASNPQCNCVNCTLVRKMARAALGLPAQN